MDSVQELTVEPRSMQAVGIQEGSYLLELSLDWIVLRASENVHRLLGESHVTLIDEPLGRFVKAQAAIRGDIPYMAIRIAYLFIP
jgi:light-regulated signal transduction histidine kinase (bacteriophytochrome)